MPRAKAKGKKGKKVTKEIKLSLVGLQYRVPASTRKFLVNHVPFRIKAVREPDNHQDPNAISIVVDDKGVPYNGMKLGYLRRQVAAVWASEIDASRLEVVKGYVAEIDAGEGIGEMLLTVKGAPGKMNVGP